MAEQDIIELAAKAIKGDQAAFEELCRRKTRSILFNAYTMTGNADDAQDVAQEAFVAMFKGIGKLKSPEAIDVWLYRIVQNCCRRFWERHAYRKHEAGEIPDAEEVDASDDDEDFIPESYMENKEDADRLYEIVLDLPEKKREAILLYYYNGLSYKEIADITGSSMKTISSNITRGREMIKKALELEAMAVISDQAITAAQTRYLATFKTMKYGFYLHAPKIAAGVGAAAVAAGLWVGVYVYHYYDTPPEFQVPVSEAPAAVTSAGDIVFGGGTGKDGHINPLTADFVGADFEIASASWEITNTDNAAVYGGDGMDASPALAALTGAEAKGWYLLTYTFTNPEGDLIYKYRAFEVR
jgi:RNA polymerase sigma-70 factor (ECF subfamily)